MHTLDRTGGIRVECFSPAEGGRTEWLVLPAMCLTVWVDDSLQAVYPHQSESENYTVEDGVDRFEQLILDQQSGTQASAD